MQVLKLTEKETNNLFIVVLIKSFCGSSRITTQNVLQYHSAWMFPGKDIDDFVQIELHSILNVHQGQCAKSLLPHTRS